MSLSTIDFNTASHAALRSTSRVVADRGVTETPPDHTSPNDERDEHDDSAHTEMGRRRPVPVQNGLSRPLDEKPVEAVPGHIIAIHTDRHQYPASGASDDGWRGIAAFSPNGALLAFAPTANMIQVWDPVMGKSRYTFHCDHVADVKFSPTGQLIAFRCGGSHWQLDSKSTCRLIIWSLSSQTTVYALEKLDLDIGHVALSWSSQFIAFMNEGGDTVDLHHLVTKTTRDIPLDSNLQVDNVIFSLVDQLVTFGKNDTAVRFWDRDTGALLWALEGNRYGVITVAFLLVDHLMVAVSVSEIKVWDVATKSVLYFFATPYFLMESSSNIMAISYEPANRLMAIASSLFGMMEIYDVTEDIPRCKFKARVSGPQAMTFLPNGRLVTLDIKDVAILTMDVANDIIRRYTIEGDKNDDGVKPLSSLPEFQSYR